ncbi:complex I assembly factor TIMMDC1, mitochondrial [Hyperolius riggenbachi]|uniref:complex I assembly factor TIMMDC1, mitochondrial n=1 Tax=Hyperolius riggenbachi TaxID=752182 RepID=UPI0035A335CE
MAEDPPPRFLPPNIQSPDSLQTGWDRVRELYRLDEHGEPSKEVQFLVKSAVTTMMVGMVYGGVPAARYYREHYIKQSKAEVYRHRMEAVRSAHNAAIRGFIRYGVRWGWRMTAFVTIFNVVNTGLTAYRDKVAMSHFAAAGAVCGGLFRLNLGLRRLVAGSLIGSLLGMPAGMMIMGLQALTKEDLAKHYHHMRQQEYQQKVEEWNEQLHLTDVLLQDMQKADTESALSEMERMNALRQQPPNPGPSLEE